MGLISLFPLEEFLPAVGGFGTYFLFFFVAAIFSLCFYYRHWRPVFCDPVILSLFGFVVTGAVVEAFHPEPSYGELARIALMILGVAVVATLCVNPGNLKAAVFGYLTAGTWLSVLMIATSYSGLSAAGSADFEESSRARAEVVQEGGTGSLKANLNEMAFIAAQAASFACAMALTSKKRVTRIMYIGLCGLCLLGSFMPVSRSGILIAAACCLTVLFKSSRQRSRSLLVLLLLVPLLFALAPSAVFSRLTFSTEAGDGKLEGRARVLTAAVENFGEYAVTGLGAGHFRNWAWGTNFATKTYVSGGHNIFLQATFYWGILGFLAVLLVVRQAYRCVTVAVRGETCSLCLRALAVSLFVEMFFTQVFYAKDFSIGLGILLGGRHLAARAGGGTVLPRGRNPATLTRRGFPFT